MENQNNIYVQILNMFVSNDHLIPWMQKPFNYEGLTYSTNAHILVAVPFQNGYEIIDKAKEYHKMDHNKDIDISVSEIKEKLSLFPVVDSYDSIGKDVECDACDGSGTVIAEFEYKNKYYDIKADCPICNGTGYASQSRQVKNGKTQIDASKQFRIGVCSFNPIFIQKLVEVAELLESDKIKLVIQKYTLIASVFKIKDVEILIMPMVPVEEDILQSIEI